MEPATISAPTLKLCVGGGRFEASEVTLKGLSFFDSLLKRWRPEKGETLFVDRNPDYFREILEGLRDPDYTPNLPIGILKKEARFWGFEVNLPEPESPLVFQTEGIKVKEIDAKVGPSVCCIPLGAENQKVYNKKGKEFDSEELPKYQQEVAGCGCIQSNTILGPKKISFEIPRAGDVADLQNLKLLLKLNKNEVKDFTNLRDNLIKDVQLVVNEERFAALDGNFLKCWEKVHLKPSHLRWREKADLETLQVLYTFPNTFNLIWSSAMPFCHVKLVVRLKHRWVKEGVLFFDYIVLSMDQRIELGEKIHFPSYITVNPYTEKFFEKRKKLMCTPFDGGNFRDHFVKRFYFCVENDLKERVPVSKVTMRLEAAAFMEKHIRVLLEDMKLQGYNCDENIYVLDIPRGSLHVQELGNIFFSIYPVDPQENLKVRIWSLARFFTRVVNGSIVHEHLEEDVGCPPTQVDTTIVKSNSCKSMG